MTAAAVGSGQVMSTEATVRPMSDDGRTIWLGPWAWVDGYMVRYFLQSGVRWSIRIPALASLAHPVRPLVATPRSTP